MNVGMNVSINLSQAVRQSNDRRHGALADLHPQIRLSTPVVARTERTD
jgi:hypothetical protein